MAKLKREYTDTHDRTHRVEHILIANGNKVDQERIIEELLHALTKAEDRLPA